MSSIVWTTVDEILFVKGLGRHRTAEGRQEATPAERLKLLQDYRKSIDVRTQWGFINKLRLIEAVDRLLRDMTTSVGTVR